MSNHWCFGIVIVIIVLFAVSTWWSYTVPKEFKDRNARWKRIWKG